MVSYSPPSLCFGICTFNGEFFLTVFPLSLFVMFRVGFTPILGLFHPQKPSICAEVRSLLTKFLLALILNFN